MSAACVSFLFRLAVVWPGMTGHNTGWQTDPHTWTFQGYWLPLLLLLRDKKRWTELSRKRLRVLHGKASRNSVFMFRRIFFNFIYFFFIHVILLPSSWQWFSNLMLFIDWLCACARYTTTRSLFLSMRALDGMCFFLSLAFARTIKTFELLAFISHLWLGSFWYSRWASVCVLFLSFFSFDNFINFIISFMENSLLPSQLVLKSSCLPKDHSPFGEHEWAFVCKGYLNRPGDNFIFWEACSD